MKRIFKISYFVFLKSFLKTFFLKDMYMEVYNSLVSLLSSVLGNKTTNNRQLGRVGRQLFGNEFLGVFPRDKIPVFPKGKSFCIINTDTSDGRGVHWTGLACQGRRVYGYDSYGRDINKLLNVKGVVNSDMSDKEQRTLERNCGQRVMSWLLVFKGNPKIALQI